MALDLDFSDDATQNPAFDPAPEGTYTLVVTGAEVKDGPKGKYINLECEIADGEFEGKKVWDILSTSPAARGLLQDKLEAMTRQDWRQDGMQLNPNDLPGLKFKGTLYISSYTDKTGKDKLNNKISAYYPIDSDVAVQPSMSI